MAGPVRLYGPSTGTTPGITPSASSGWGVTAQMVRRVPSTSKTNTSLSTIVSSTSTSTVHLQWVYPLQTGIEFSTSDTIKGSFRYQTASPFQTQYSVIVVRIMASDGTTVRATLYGYAAGSQGGAEIAITAGSRKVPQGGPKNLQANYTTVAGDYLVIEIGAGQVTGSSGNVTLTYGDPSATADLADADGNTSNNVPWIEFSNDILTPATVSASATVSTGTFTIGGPVITGRESEGATISGTTLTQTGASLSASAQAKATVSLGSLTLQGIALIASQDAGGSVNTGTFTIGGPVITGRESEGAIIESADAILINESEVSAQITDESGDYSVLINRGTLTTGGTTVAAKYGSSAQVAAALLTLAGEQIIARQSAGSTVTHGTLTMNGVALSAKEQEVGTITCGVLTINGLDLLARAAVSVALGRGTLTFTGTRTEGRLGFRYSQFWVI